MRNFPIPVIHISKKDEVQRLDLMYTHLSHYHSEHYLALVIFLSRVDLNGKHLSNTLAFTIDFPDLQTVCYSHQLQRTLGNSDTQS